MAQFLEQNLLWVILIGAMLAMHLGGHRHGAQAGHGATHAGCGGHALHGTLGREEHSGSRPRNAGAHSRGSEPRCGPAALGPGRLVGAALRGTNLFPRCPGGGARACGLGGPA